MTTDPTPEQGETLIQDWRSVGALSERLNKGALCQTLSSHAIRHYVRHAASNGLAPHVRRLGKKILISESGFMRWLDSQRVA